MRQLLFWLKWVSIIIGITGLILFLFVIFNRAYFNTSFIIDTKLASDFGSFFGGFIGTFFSFLSMLLIIYTIMNQNIENRKSMLMNNFFKMLDYHNQNVEQINIPHIDKTKNVKESGRRAFVVYKIQIKRLIENVRKIINDEHIQISDKELIDICYNVFFYGLDERWQEFIRGKLSNYCCSNLIIDKLLIKIQSNPELKIGRTNQTNLSTYFRNMYNAIKLIDKSNVLSLSEKKEIIKIYRAQLSNPELYVLFFNLMSRFGKKWVSNNYVIRYELIKNIPKDYCDGFNPKDYFLMKYEDED